MIGKEKERGDLFMNKNLKRALNTTAAVSMSLAMVLGAVAPVTNVSAARLNDTITDKVAAKDAYKQVNALYEAIGTEVYDAYKTATFNDVAEVGKFNSFEGKALNELGDVKLKENTDAWDTSTTLAVLVKFVADNSSYVDRC